MTRDNIAGFMPGISAGFGLGYFLKPPQQDGSRIPVRDQRDEERRAVRRPDAGKHTASLLETERHAHRNGD